MAPRTVHQLGPRSFSEWVEPTDMRDHVIECCSCGLQHRFQYRVVIGPNNKAQVLWRAKRLPRKRRPTR